VEWPNHRGGQGRLSPRRDGRRTRAWLYAGGTAHARAARARLGAPAFHGRRTRVRGCTAVVSGLLRTLPGYRLMSHEPLAAPPRESTMHGGMAVPTAVSSSESGWPSPWRAWWTVVILTFTYVVSFVDRTVLSLLIEPIKTDLSLNDTQIGLLQGLAFGVFYAVMGLPLGWLADRTSRRGLIAVGAAVWCAATTACGLASSFIQLFAARIAVGVGEAALSP